MEVARSMKDIHITVQDGLAARLEELSRRLDANRTTLVREAVEEYVCRRERELLADSMARYAAEMAPESGAFVEETWPSVNRQILESTEW